MGSEATSMLFFFRFVQMSAVCRQQFVSLLHKACASSAIMFAPVLSTLQTRFSCARFVYVRREIAQGNRDGTTMDIEENQHSLN
jgi:hypothetical protein